MHPEVDTGYDPSPEPQIQRSLAHLAKSQVVVGEALDQSAVAQPACSPLASALADEIETLNACARRINATTARLEL